MPMGIHHMKPTRILKMAVQDKGPRPKGDVRPIWVNRHMCMTYIVRQVYLVTKPDTLSMSRPGLREPLGVNLCI